MLRTGKSLLANNLPHPHLGCGKMLLCPSEQILIAYTDWRKPQYPVQTIDYAAYIQSMTWFLDPLCVHPASTEWHWPVKTLEKKLDNGLDPAPQQALSST
jgi:hypothetical protein